MTAPCIPATVRANKRVDHLLIREHPWFRSRPEVDDVAIVFQLPDQRSELELGRLDQAADEAMDQCVTVVEFEQRLDRVEVELPIWHRPIWFAGAAISSS